MKIQFLCLLLFCALLPARGQEPARMTLFNDGWRFARGGQQGAEQPHFNDSGWRAVQLPHDWSIEDLPGTPSPFHPDAVSQVSGGFTTGGTAWYRKTFSVAAAQKGKRLHLQFDGVYMNADVWLNGKLLGNHPYGYTSFWFDLTDGIRYGAENVLAVKVKNEGENSRWYSGSGIYRHVWLKLMETVHVAPWGIYITTPRVSAASAAVHIRTRVQNESGVPAPVTVVTRIVDAKGMERARETSGLQIDTGADYEADQQLTVSNPQLWSTDTPVLYTALTEVYRNGVLADRAETRFGIRTIAFDVAHGFRLNGRPMKLKGGCVHHDNGPLGARAYDRAEERRVELLKQSGFNAIRCAHNPPSVAFLDACDRLGMLVIDEAFDMWRLANNPFDYHLYFDAWWQKDLESMVLRDRNHPSVILWSIGNEIKGMETPGVVGTAQMLGDYIRKLEPTRPVMAAVNGLRPQKDPFFATLDIGGYNYAFGGDHKQKSLHEMDHERVPGRIMLGAESYPLEAFGAWMEVVDHPYLVGDFVWTAFDYIGEASIGWRGYMQERSFYPWTLAYCGDIDICGWKRPQSYYRDALWKKDQVSLFVKPPRPTFPLNPRRESWSKWHWDDVVADWNWEGSAHQPLEVQVYSSCEAVELFLNNRSLGRKATSRATRFMAAWQVPYAPGALKAVGYSGGKPVGTSVLQTAGKPARLQLTADRKLLKADGQDLSYITVEVTDEKGVRHAKADHPVRFSIEGPGTIAGVGNANPVSLESYQQPVRKAWQGRCLVIVKGEGRKGPIVLKAAAEGLEGASLTINVQ